MDGKIVLDAPNLGEKEKAYLLRALESNYISSVGPFVPEFEERFAKAVGAAGAVAVQSGTAALHAALHALGIGPGDEVIVPVLTFVATVNPVMYVGATPVFADVDPRTWNLDPSDAARKITSRTKAIVPVHLYGHICSMGRLRDLAAEHSLALIEDATESLGAVLNGRQAGCWGDLACFSFNGNKVITTGGGGMITGQDVELLARIKFLVNQAREEDEGYSYPEIGFNYRMTNIEAALGLAQLARLDELLEKKRAFRKIYQEVLGCVDGVEFQQEEEYSMSSCWLTGIKCPTGRSPEQLVEALRQKEIPSRRVFSLVVASAAYQEFQAQGFPAAEEIFAHGICLPGSTLNSLDTVRSAALEIKEVLS